MTIINGSGTENETVGISDDELAALALAADPDAALDAEAICLWDMEGFGIDSQLPSWYMSAPMPRTQVVRGWRRPAIVLVIAAFLTIDIYGLCNTYGDLRVTPSQLHH